ncbi:MAG TPA: TetR/AcrR family transcriptional regulator C-terminal domain-containing protein [Bacillota bacterium]|nr:TetR/AcrR family transcriptional regulator C-terminal domain-containing protein [Bacillota bacterium]
MEKKESQRVTETKEKIRDAFFELYESKKIEKISIRDITDKAQLNRSTFYMYYRDIYDLLEKTEDEMRGELTGYIRDTVVRILREENVQPFLPPKRFFKRYYKFLRVLLSANGDPQFIYTMKKEVKVCLKEQLLKEQIPVHQHIDYVMEYIASAQIGLVSYWMQNEMEIPIEELGEMIKKISLNGPLGYLKG